jgi:hypothetical protein
MLYERKEGRGEKGTICICRSKQEDDGEAVEAESGGGKKIFVDCNLCEKQRERERERE